MFICNPLGFYGQLKKRKYDRAPEQKVCAELLSSFGHINAKSKSIQVFRSKGLIVFYSNTNVKARTIHPFLIPWYFPTRRPWRPRIILEDYITYWTQSMTSKID